MRRTLEDIMSPVAKTNSIGATKGIMARLKEFISHKKLSMHKFGELTSIAAGGISRAINAEGKYSMGIDKFMNIFTVFPDLNPSWLLFGDGPMLKDDIEKATGKSYRDLVESNHRMEREITRLTAKQDAYKEIFSMFAITQDHYKKPEA